MKDGRHIEFQRASLSPAGTIAGEHDLATVSLTKEPEKAPPKKARRSRKKSKATGAKAPRSRAAASARARSRSKPARSAPAAAPPPTSLVEELKAWRLKVNRWRDYIAYRRLIADF